MSSGVLATSCEDGGINFWDLRRPSSPLSVIEGAHSHWAMSVKYCPDNEKVVATGGGTGASTCGIDRGLLQTLREMLMLITMHMLMRMAAQVVVRGRERGKRTRGRC